MHPANSATCIAVSPAAAAESRPQADTENTVPPNGQVSASEWQSLAAVAAEIRSCTRCGLSESRTNAVPGAGSEFPAIMFVGEGPGLNEDRQGLPFVGRAGALLDELLALVPLRRDDVYITNVVKCRPPDNRDPLPGEVTSCWPFLEAQIQFLRPRVIATLGRHALMRFFPEARISDRHGRPMRWRDGIMVFPLYHPAAGLRSSRLRQALEEDFVKLPEAVIAALDYSKKEPSPKTDSAEQPVAREQGAGYGNEHEDDDDQKQIPMF